jgi:hypothetical protein
VSRPPSAALLPAWFSFTGRGGWGGGETGGGGGGEKKGKKPDFKKPVGIFHLQI